MARAVVAALSEEEDRNIGLERVQARSTEPTTTMEPALRQMSARIRKKVDSIAAEENDPRGRCVAASMIDTRRHAQGPLSILGRGVRTTERSIVERRLQVVDTAQPSPNHDERSEAPTTTLLVRKP